MAALPPVLADAAAAKLLAQAALPSVLADADDATLPLHRLRCRPRSQMPMTPHSLATPSPTFSSLENDAMRSMIEAMCVARAAGETLTPPLKPRQLDQLTYAAGKKVIERAQED